MIVSIIIPVYNEEKTVISLVNRVFSANLPKGYSKEVIIVNDGSTDSTLAKLSSLKVKFRLINHVKNSGKGAAIKTGIASAEGDIVLIQDADLEYNPDDFQRLLLPFEDPRIQVVYGSRFIDYPLRLSGKNKTPLPIHWIANKLLTAFTNLIFGNSVSDMETCYKVVRKSLIDKLDIKANRFDFEPEITAKILKRGIKIVEIPIKVVPRSYEQGKKIGWKDGVSAIVTLVKYRFFE